MQRTTKITTLALFLLTICPCAVALDMMLPTQDGQCVVIDSELPLKQFRNDYALSLEPVLAWNSQKANKHASNNNNGAALGYPRRYANEITSVEKGDIRFIVTTLANRNLISIAMVKSELEAAGNRIDHVHPLRFLMTIFTDEEMKVGVRNIRGKGWVWNHFIGGVKESLAAEYAINNVTDEQIHHFAAAVNMNPNLILPVIAKKRWDEFVDLLISQIPREGNPNRYDM